MKKMYQGFPLFALALSVSTSGLIPVDYDIYIGDINDDGQLDYYFHGKAAEQTEEASPAPLSSNAHPSYAIYRYGDEYLAAVDFSFTDEQLAQKLNEGMLRPAVVSDESLSGPEDVVFFQYDANGISQFLLRDEGVHNSVSAVQLQADVLV